MLQLSLNETRAAAPVCKRSACIAAALTQTSIVPVAAASSAATATARDARLLLAVITWAPCLV